MFTESSGTMFRMFEKINESLQITNDNSFSLQKVRNGLKDRRWREGNLWNFGGRRRRTLFFYFEC